LIDENQRPVHCERKQRFNQGPGSSTNSRYFDISLSGLTSSGATVTLQRSFDDGATWKTVQAYTADVEDWGFGASLSTVLYRLTCSNYSTGTILYVLG